MTEEEIPPSSQGSQTPVETQEDYKEKYFWLLAEMENARKRLQREKQDLMRFATEGLLIEILQPVETLENALSFAQQMPPETRNWAMGFEMILAQFKEIFSQHGIISFSSHGEQFDPYKHDAVEIEETTDYPAGIIIHEFVKGYKCGERILRPARVKVAKAPVEKSDKENV